MKNMKKVLLILASCCLLLFIVLFLIWGNKARLLAHTLGKKLGVPVYIEELTFKKDKVIIHNLVISNPPEAHSPFALKVEKITITTPLSYYLRDPIIINKCSVENIFMNIEFYTNNQETGNWITLLNNTNTEHTSIFSIERSFIIHKLHLTDIDINLTLADGTLKTLTPINELIFKHLTSEEGIPIHEFTEIIIQNLINQIFVIKGLKTIFEAPQKVIEALLSPFIRSDKKSKEESTEASQMPITP